MQAHAAVRAVRGAQRTFREGHGPRAQSDLRASRALPRSRRGKHQPPIRTNLTSSTRAPNTTRKRREAACSRMRAYARHEGATYIPRMPLSQSDLRGSVPRTDRIADPTVAAALIGSLLPGHVPDAIGSVADVSALPPDSRKHCTVRYSSDSCTFLALPEAASQLTASNSPTSPEPDPTHPAAAGSRDVPRSRQSNV